MADTQKAGGVTIILIVLFILWWLSKNGLAFLHGEPKGSIVQSTVGGVTYPATVTDFGSTGPDNFNPATGSCCG